jgi:hypothetical protein
MVPLILNLAIDEVCVVSYTPRHLYLCRKSSPITTEYEVRCADLVVMEKRQLLLLS